jgi:hypothetical protein
MNKNAKVISRYLLLKILSNLAASMSHFCKKLLNFIALEMKYDPKNKFSGQLYFDQNVL